MTYVAPVPTFADLRKGTHLIRFAWNTGPAAKPAVSLHIFPDTDKCSVCDHTNHMTRREARVEWQRLRLSGFVVDQSSGFGNGLPDPNLTPTKETQ